MDQAVQLNSQHKGVLSTVTQTDLSLTLEFKETNKKLSHDYELKVVTKDGEEEIHTGASSFSADTGIFVYDISKIKGKIEKVVIAGTEIKLD